MDILVTSGCYPVHSFDLYGVLVDADNLGEQKIARYEELAKIQGIDPAVSSAVVAISGALEGGPKPYGTKKGKGC